MSVVEELPDVICRFEICSTNLRSFVGKLYWFDFVNKLSNSDQSSGVDFGFTLVAHNWIVDVFFVVVLADTHLGVELYDFSTLYGF